MKKILFMILLVGFGCEMEQPTKKDVKVNSRLADQRSSMITLHANDNILVKLYNSEAWQKTSPTIIQSIDNSAEITFTSYKNSPVEAVTFRLKTNAIFEALVFLHYEGTFWTIKAKSIKKGDFTYVAITNLKDQPYYDFYVDKESRFGQFIVHKDLPVGEFNNQSGKTLVTCSQVTTTMGACMQCAINECTSSWACTIACAVFAPECLVGFGLACTFGQQPEQKK